MSKPVTIAERTERRCSKCGVVKPMDSFYKSKASSDGHGNQCKPCAKQAAKESAKRNPEARRAAQIKWAANNSEKIKVSRVANSAKNVERVRKWRKDNPEKFAARAATRNTYMLRWRPASREKVRAWNEQNIWRLRSQVAKRRAMRKRATPAWANHEKIREFYKIAAQLEFATGQKFHVDHIVPLQSEIVCGLHNEFNLQILTAFRNISKGNRHWPDKP